MRRAAKAAASGAAKFGNGGASKAGGAAPVKSAREALKELTQLRDDALISQAEWESGRKKLIDAVVDKGIAGLGERTAA